MNTTSQTNNWKSHLENELPLLGHRNWILIVDSAYPLQSSDSIVTISSNEEIEPVIETVMNAVKNANHIKPVVYQDKEFSYMTDDMTAGCVALREKINNVLKEYDPKVILHDEIFPKLDTASKLFKILVIKTNCTVAYSSVFVELDCGYWNADSEKALREAIAKQ